MHHRVPRHHHIGTDAVRTGAVAALSGQAAGRLDTEPLRVGRRGDVPGAGNGVVQCAQHLVHTGDDQHLPGAVAHGRHPIAHTVDVHQLPVLGDGVAAHQKRAAAQRLVHQRLLLRRVLGGVPVDEGIALLRQPLLQPQLVHRHHAAPGYTVRLGDQLQRLLHGLGSGGTVIGVKVPLLHSLHRLGAGQVIHFLFDLVHGQFSFPSCSRCA